MKKLSFLLPGLLFLFLQAGAQKIHFTDTTNYWGTLHGEGCSYSKREVYPGKDTIISGKKYIILDYLDVSSDCVHSSGNWFLASLFAREDTIAGKVYMARSFGDSVREYLLMDYNLHAGDIVHFSYPEDSTLIDSVLSVDSVLIGGFYYKVFSLYITNALQGTLYHYYNYIEGIGGIDNWDGTPYSGESLACFKHGGIPDPYWDGTAPSMNVPYRNSLGVNYFTNGCFPAEIKSVHLPKTEVYPNPVSTELTVSAADKITSIAITNIVGQVVLSNNYNAQKVQVDVSALPSGVYLLRINDTEIRKFVKQ